MTKLQQTTKQAKTKGPHQLFLGLKIYAIITDQILINLCSLGNASDGVSLDRAVCRWLVESVSPDAELMFSCLL